MKKTHAIASIFFLFTTAAALAIDFQTAVVDDDVTDVNCDTTVTPDGRYLTLWTSISEVNPLVRELYLTELGPDGSSETKSLGFVGEVSNPSTRHPVRIETNGGRTWAAVQRQPDAASFPEISLIQIYPDTGFAIERAMGATSGTPAIALAVDRDTGMPTVAQVASGSLNLARRSADGTYEKAPVLRAEAGFSFEINCNLNKISDSYYLSIGRIMNTETTGDLMIYEIPEPADFTGLVYPTPDVVVSDIDLNRHRAAVVDGLAAPVIILADGRSGEGGQVAVRDDLSGWVTTRLPDTSGTIPAAFFLDIASRPGSDRAYIVWQTLGAKTIYAEFLPGAKTFEAQELVGFPPRSLAIAHGEEVGQVVVAGVDISSDNLAMALASDVADFDVNGFSGLQEEAFGIRPGSVNLERAPQPVKVTSDGRVYPGFFYWRLAGGSGTHPYVVDDLEYYPEYSLDLINWRTTQFFSPLEEFFTIQGRGEVATHRATIDFETRSSRPVFFRVRVRRVE